ncbi:hypothetical protein BHE90_002178 [Fusarium euwallaceae]|uniref:Uncharacterized protein n=2 Tax=Fusarium solani species complex TaxID=232080 RepID=A0A428U5X4_9HYPO|nr:hypothetical protein CEP52_003970 [Fusarium oligoseptatum]RTE83303.1 hypothetical protein BHE90_002178 [Fusarium euwallaceae]
MRARQNVQSGRYGTAAVEEDEAVGDAQKGCEATEKRGRERKGRQTVEIAQKHSPTSLELCTTSKTRPLRENNATARSKSQATF